MNGLSLSKPEYGSDGSILYVASNFLFDHEQKIREIQDFIRTIPGKESTDFLG